MSETQFPSGPRGAEQLSRPSSSPEVNARLIGVPNEVRAEVQTERRTLRLSGEVVRQNDDGSVRVRTERGDIDVRVQEGSRVPQRGERVQIEVQPNRNPEQPPDSAVIRPESRSTPSPQTNEPPPQSRPTSTPVSVDVRPQTEAPVRSSEPPAAQTPVRAGSTTLPPEGSLVQLQPLPTSEASALPPLPPVEQIATTLTNSISFSAQIISSDAVAQLQTATTELLATSRPPLTSPTTPVVVTQGPILQSATPEAQIITQTAQNSPAPTASGQTPLSTSTLPNITRPSIESFALPQTNAPITPIAQPTTQAATSIDQFFSKPLAFNARIEAITPPLPETQNLNQALQAQNQSQVQGKPENLIIQNQRAETQVGIVTNITGNQLPVLSVFFPQIGSEQLFALQFPSTESITIGTQLHLTPQNATTSAQITNPAALSAQGLPLPALLAPQTSWPAVEEVLQSLNAAAPAAARAVLNVTPSPANPAQFGPAALFFIAAIRGGDITQWLGDKAQDILRTAGKSGALNRLSQEGSLLNRIASEPAGQDWRALNVPMFYEGDLQKMALYYKHERDAEGDENSSIKGTRFVFDLALDRMGKVQLDGLFRASRLDLVIRTEENFSEATRAEMRRIYARGLRDTGVSGELSFQNQPESWVTISAEKTGKIGVSA